MSTLTVVDGNLLHAGEQYIVHQTNCCSRRAAHLAWSVFREFPYANVYAERDRISKDYCDEPGTISIRGGSDGQRAIIALFGQYYPGAPKYPTSNKDGYEARQRYFQYGLKHIAAIPGLESVAFPYGIGCGAAGGNWAVYERMLRQFSESVPARVVLYRHRVPSKAR